MKRNDLFISLFLCILSVFVFFLSDTIRTMLLVEKSPIINSQFYPKLLSALLFVCGIFLGIQALLDNQISESVTDVTQAQHNKESQGVIRMFATGLVCIVYLFLFIPLGFLISTMLFMATIILLLGSRTWYSLMLPSVLIPVSIYVLFKLLLGVPLPRGILGFF